MSVLERFTNYCPPILDGQVDYLNTSALIRTETGELLDYPNKMNPLYGQRKQSIKLNDLRDFGIVVAAGLAAWNYGSLSVNQFKEGNTSASDISLIVGFVSSSVASYFGFRLAYRLANPSKKPPVN